MATYIVVTENIVVEADSMTEVEAKATDRRLRDFPGLGICEIIGKEDLQHEQEEAQ